MACRAAQLVREHRFDELIKAVRGGCPMSVQVTIFAINHNFYGLLRWAVEHGAPVLPQDRMRVRQACLDYKGLVLADMPQLWKECVADDIRVFYPLTWRNSFSWDGLWRWANKHGMCIEV
jgi:hypothetical protein